MLGGIETGPVGTNTVSEVDTDEISEGKNKGGGWNSRRKCDYGAESRRRTRGEGKTPVVDATVSHMTWEYHFSKFPCQCHCQKYRH
jgi:hypothetical protein